jgi:hypothetical protein
LTPLENFDTSHWKTADKSWMKEREKQWPEIEQMLYTLNMTKKGRGIVRRYFLKGSLPHWKKLHDWDRDSTVRHLNLLLFLYLHPSLGGDVCVCGEFYRNRDQHRRLGRGCRSGGNRWR